MEINISRLFGVPFFSKAHLVFRLSQRTKGFTLHRRQWKKGKKEKLVVFLRWVFKKGLSETKNLFEHPSPILNFSEDFQKTGEK
jgi:hypothetical protein